MYQTILYPVDGSDGSKAPLEDVRTLAKRFDATVHVLYVVDDRPEALGLVGRPDREGSPGMAGRVGEEGNPGMGSGTPEADELRSRLSERAQRIVDDVGSRLDEASVKPVIKRGAPHETIVEYADEIGADVIVMGTHGRGGVERFLLGSVTEKVVRTARVPVLTVREPRDDE